MHIRLLPVRVECCGACKAFRRDVPYQLTKAGVPKWLAKILQ
jgi:hypothetical protein